MQRLTSAAPIDDATLATYEKTVSIIQRHLSPSVAQLYATARRNAEGNLEWWTDRQGLAKPFSALSEAEQQAVQNKRQKYQETLVSFIDQLVARGDTSSAQALQILLTPPQDMACYGVGGEPVLVNWAIVPKTTAPQTTPCPPPRLPWWRRHLPWLLLLPLLLVLALAYWWFLLHPISPTFALPTNSELTQDNPSINLAKQKDFGRIKVNLTWQQGAHQQPIDLDIAAFIKLKDGYKTGVEALSKHQGNYDKPPYMALQKDQREGDDQNGEWLFINGSRWQDIDEILIYSFIYGGVQNWQGTDATITIHVPGQQAISTTLNSGNERNNVAAIARLKNVDGDIKVERLNRFFFNRESMDKHYDWGFKWTPGASKN